MTADQIIEHCRQAHRRAPRDGRRTMERGTSGRARGGLLPRLGASRNHPRRRNVAAGASGWRHLGRVDPRGRPFSVLRLLHRQVEPRAGVPGTREGCGRLRVLEYLRRGAQPRQHLSAQLRRGLRRVPASAAELHVARCGGLRGRGAQASRPGLRGTSRARGDADRARQEHRDLQRAQDPRPSPVRAPHRGARRSSRPASSTASSARSAWRRPRRP